MNAERIEIDGEHLTAALTAEIMKRPKLGFVAPSSAKNSSKGGESSSGWNCDLSLIYCTKDHDKENYSMRDLWFLVVMCLKCQIVKIIILCK